MDNSSNKPIDYLCEILFQLVIVFSPMSSLINLFLSEMKITNSMQRELPS